MSETDGLLGRANNANNTSTGANEAAAADLPSIWRMICQGGAVQPIEGSTARDHLANERTFLAWIRTSLSLTGVGIGLLKIPGISNVAGYLVIALGVFTLSNATWRYMHVMRLVSSRQFQPNVTSILLVVAIIVMIILAMLCLHFAGKL